MKTLACVTMVFNELDWLPVWLEYYGHQVGFEHCYVIDHGSTDGSTDELKGAHKVWIPRSPHDNEKRGSFVSHFCAALLEYYDFVIYTDVDEIVVADPAKYKGLVDYVADAPTEKVITCLGLNVLHKMHQEIPLRKEIPILSQRRYAFAVGAMCKPLLISRKVSWSPGFHSYDGSISFGSLFLFHLSYADHQTAMRRQEKRRSQLFPNEKTSSHHRLDNETVSKRMINWSKMEIIEDVTLDENCSHMRDFISRIQASEATKAYRIYKFDINIKMNCLWQIPERFKTVF